MSRDEKKINNNYFSCSALVAVAVVATLFIFINMVRTLMISAKMATLGLLKIKVFLNKYYDVIISAHDVTNKVLSRDSIYILDRVM